MRPKDFIKSIPGEIRKSDGSYTDVLTELGFTGSPVTVTNDGYHEIGVSTIRKDGSDYELADVINEIGDAVTTNKALTTRGDMLYRGASIPQRLAKGTSGYILTQGANDPAWAAWSGPAASVALTDTGELYAAATVEAALAEIGAKPILAVPATGTISDGTVYRNSGPDANEPMGWVVTESGTMGTLVGTTGSITTGTAALTVSALGGLAVGNYISIAGVTGSKQISSLPAALGSTTVLANSANGQKYLTVAAITNFVSGETIEVSRGEGPEARYVIDLVASASTTVDVESATGQKVLSVAATTGFTVGDPVLIDSAGVAEWKIIESIQAGVSLTMTVNLANTHAIGVTVATKYIKTTVNLTQTHAAADTVTNCVVLGSNVDATVNTAAVSYFNAVFSPYGYVNTDWKAWTPTVSWTTGTPASIAQVARYKITDKTVYFNYTAESADSNGCTALAISLPVAAKDNNALIALSSQQLNNATWINPMAYIDDDSAGIAFRAFATVTDGQAIKVIVSGFYEIA